MDRRSTNAVGYTHFGGDVTAQVESSHGVRLTGGSTGGIVEAVGDDTNVTLTLRGQGAGGVVIGSTNQALTLNSTTVRVGATSTTALAYVQRYTVQFTEPDLSSGPANANSTYTVTGATTNALYMFTPRLLLKAGYGIGSVRCSSANELTINWTNEVDATNSGSTNRGTLLQFGF